MHGVAVLTASDRCASGKMDDLSGEIAVDFLKDNGFSVVQKKIVPDDFSSIVEVLEKWSRNDSVQLIITTGGTGLSPRDVTPQATLSVIEYQVPGIPEFIRQNSVNKNEIIEVPMSEYQFINYTKVRKIEIEQDKMKSKKKSKAKTKKKEEKKDIIKIKTRNRA